MTVARETDEQPMLLDAISSDSDSECHSDWHSDMDVNMSTTVANNNNKVIFVFTSRCVSAHASAI